MKDQNEIPPPDLTMDRREILAMRLAELRRRHRDLDEGIAATTRAASADSLELRRLKKQKLALKDEISRIEDQITPDIIA